MTYLPGRLARGRAIIEAIAVFRLDERGRWSDGVTTFVADDKATEYLKDKRRDGFPWPRFAIRMRVPHIKAKRYTLILAPDAVVCQVIDAGEPVHPDAIGKSRIIGVP